MLETGVWRVGRFGNLNVIIDVLDHVAVGYLWSKETGILSHVWLFNGLVSSPENTEPKSLSLDAILTEEYSVPAAFSEIEVALNHDSLECIISWHGKPRALLRVGEPIGFSTMVRTSNEVALHFDAAFETDNANPDSVP